VGRRVAGLVPGADPGLVNQPYNYEDEDVQFKNYYDDEEYIGCGLSALLFAVILVVGVIVVMFWQILT